MLLVKQRSLLKANWWPRIIGKVNPLNVIERTTRAKSKIHFHRRSDTSAVEKISEGGEKETPHYSSVPEYAHRKLTRAPPDAFTAHIKISKTHHAHTLRSWPRDTLFNAAWYRRFVLRKLLRSALRRSMRSAKLEIGSIRPSCGWGTKRVFARGQVKVLSPSCYSSRYTL